MQLRGVVKCPKCGTVYHRALYDFDYISCTKSGCGQDFIKCTGQPWPRNSEPVELAATDVQQLKAEIAAIADSVEDYTTTGADAGTIACIVRDLRQLSAV